MPEQTEKQRCRYLRTSGVPCTSPALRGEPYCYYHCRDRRRARSTHDAPAIIPATIEVPLLDDSTAILAVITDIVRATLAGTLDHRISGRALYGAQLAGIELARMNAARRPRHGASNAGEAAQAPAPEPVDTFTLTPEGEELAPESPYHGPEGEKERSWSLSEYLYKRMFPAQAADPLPEEGYIDPKVGSVIPAIPGASLPTPQPPPEAESEAPAQPVAGVVPTMHAAQDVPAQETAAAKDCRRKDHRPRRANRIRIRQECYQVLPNESVSGGS
jgi:hypothetical protein